MHSIIPIISLVISNLIGVYIIFNFEKILCGSENEINNYKLEYIMVVLLLTMINLFNNPFLNLFITFIITFYIMHKFDLSSSKRIIITNLFFILLLAIIEEVVFVIVSFIINDINITNYQLLVRNLLLIIGSKSIIVFLYKGVSELFLKKNYNYLKSTQTHIVLCSLILLLVSIANIAIVAQDEIAEGFCAFSAISCLAIYLYIIKITGDMEEIATDIKTLVALNVKVQYLQENYDQLFIRYKESRKIIHDYKNHLMILETVYNLDYSRGKEYSDKLLKQMDEKNIFDVEDVNVITIITNKYIQICHSEHIEFIYELMTNNIFFIDDMDWVTILTNLLDNAIENLDKYNPCIELKIAVKHNNLVIDVKNSCTNNPIIKNNSIATSKTKDRDNHGYGIENVKYIVINKYNGSCQIEIEKEIFHFNIIVPIP